MTRKELEKMVSLADDIYIEELYSAKIYSREKFSPVKIISAAAVLAVIIGAGAIALSIGKENAVPDIPPITSELNTEITDYTFNTEKPSSAKETAEPEIDADFDYSVYFGIEKFDGIIDYTLDAGGGEYFIGKGAASDTLPFDTDIFTDTRDVTVYFGSDGKAVNARIFYSNIHLNSRDIIADITINDNGALFPEYWVNYDEVLENAPERFGVKIAGYKKSDVVLDYKDLCAIFRVNGVGYTVSTYGMTYAEAVSIIDSLIESNLRAADFDISKGYKRFISLEEANVIKPYAGHIPQIDMIGDMSFESCEMRRVNDDDMIYIHYKDDRTYKPAGSSDTGKYISITYYTNEDLFRYNTHIKGAPDELSVNTGLYETETVGELKRYEFNFDMNGFYIGGEAVCTEEEITQYLAALMLTEEFGGVYKLLRPVPDNIPISAPYSEAPEDFHRGVDFAAPEGTEVCAAADGTVTGVDAFNSAYGILITIDHGNGITTRYAHLNEVKVTVGDKVKKGEVIALSGKTGATEGGALQFEVIVSGKEADPELFLEPAFHSNVMMVGYNGREFPRGELSEETLTWLDWYNSLSPDEQLAVSYVPQELR